MLAQLSTQDLVSTLDDLLVRERKIVVAFLQHLGEIDRRRIHLELGFPSLFGFCTDRLKLSTGTAWRRCTAVKLIDKHPIIADYLLDNRLTLAALGELKDVLDGDDALQLLEQAAGKTQLEVKALVAALRPKPPMRNVIAKVATLELDVLAVPPVNDAVPTAIAAAPAANDDIPAAQAPSPTAPVTISRLEPRPTVVPLSAELHRLHLTVTGAFMDDVRHATALYSHTVRDRDLVRVIHECVKVAIKAKLRRRRRGDKSRAPKPATGRYIPADMSRAVWDRDDSRCAFVGPDGHRCNSTHCLQIHHLDAYALGGEATLEKLALRCAAHNQYEADLVFGAEFMAKKRRKT